MRIVAAVLAFAVATLPAAAQIDNPTPKAKTPAKAAAKKAAPAAAKAPRESSMPLADRIAIQFDLAWAAEYPGPIDGEPNDKATAAIKAFQRSHKFKETGVLNASERALLAAAAKARQNQVGWRMLDDPATGARLGIPSRHVPNRSAGRTGTKWSSAQGQIQVETFRTREPGTTLAAIYEQQRKEPPTRRLSLNVLKSDSFVLSGMQNLKRFYVRAELRDGEVRGMTVLYDQATQPIMDPVAAAMAGSFAGFPDVTGAAPFGPSPRRGVEYGSGIVVSAAGHIVTDRRVTEGCRVLVVAGHGDADRQAENEELALLRVYGAVGFEPAALAAGPAQEPAGLAVTLIGIADPQAQDGGNTVSTAPSRLKGDQLEPSPQAGFSGGGALDDAGRLLGMVQLRTQPAAANPAPPIAALVPAATIRAFLAAQKLTPAAGNPGLDAAKGALVRVICVRR